MWFVIICYFIWEKLNYDLDNDGLYDVYVCIWVSDVFYYNSGVVIYLLVYNYCVNKIVV